MTPIQPVTNEDAEIELFENDETSLPNTGVGNTIVTVSLGVIILGLVLLGAGSIKKKEN